MPDPILVVGGAGYVGSHTCKALAKAGYLPVVYDSLHSGHRWAVQWGPLIEADLQDEKKLIATIKTYSPVAILHFASLIQARESIEKPDLYYQHNILGTLQVLRAMRECAVPYLIFSSSAAVYGDPIYLPIDESHPKNPTHPYGRSKLFCEKIIEDFASAYAIQYANLRYFNAAGADAEGDIGEAHKPETHLIPLLLETALGKREAFTLFGDGSIVRDFIHVSDLGEAHRKALEWLIAHPKQNLSLNIGSEKGYSILDILQCRVFFFKNPSTNASCNQRTQLSYS